MATVAQPLAKCVLNYLYSITRELLDKLRSIIEQAIFFIDAQILKLRMLLAQCDLLKIWAEKLNDLAQAAIEKVKNALISGIDGPIGDVRPEFYKYFTDPIIGLIDASLSAFSPYTERFINLVSIVAYYDMLIAYWTGIKEFMLASLDVIDDAIYLKTQELGNKVP